MMKNAKSLPSETIFSGGAMAEWLGRALQKLARRFDSGSCLQFSKSSQLTNRLNKNRKARTPYYSLIAQR
jgi:hypothetical protein